MGNCSLKAVSDAASQGPNEKGAIRTAARGKKRVELLPPPGNGVWKVKLVINPKDLETILSEEVNAAALIQQMRLAANSTPSRRKSSCRHVTDRFVC